MAIKSLRFKIKFVKRKIYEIKDLLILMLVSLFLLSIYNILPFIYVLKNPQFLTFEKIPNYMDFNIKCKKQLSDRYLVALPWEAINATLL